MIPKKQFQFNPQEDNAISEVGTDKIIIYIDDIKPEIITQVVIMYNEGKTTEQIGKYLDKADGVTLEESEYIVEQIANYLKLVAENPADEPVIVESESPDIHPIPTDGKPSGQQGLFQNYPYNDLRIDNYLTSNVADINKGAVGPVENIPGKKPRQARTIQITTGKSVSAEDYLKQLEEKMQITKVLAEVKPIEIPTGISKAGRELLVELSKEYQEMIGKYIQKIQSM